MKRFNTNELQQHEIDHSKIVRDNAGECSLFLKRNSDFPIKVCSVNLYGSGARRTIKGGKGSGDVNTRYTVTIEQGLINAGFKIETGAWMDSYDILVEKSVKDYWENLIKEAEENNTSPYVLLMTRPKPAVEYDMNLIGKGEINIYVIARDSSEGMERENKKGDYQLLDSEIRDIKLLASKKEKFMLALNVGGVIDLSPILGCVQNILLISQLGSETGNIFADILIGKTMPSGKLTTSWAKNIKDYPSTNYFGMPTEMEYREGVFVGYRYFNTFDVKPQFAFGYGIGYTDFSFTPIEFDIKQNQVIIDVKVQNIGEFRGKEVIQVYYSKAHDKVSPNKQLIGFAKTRELNPQDGQDLKIVIDMLDACVYSQEESAFVLQKGVYQLHVGNSLDNTVCACSIALRNDFISERVHNLTCSKIDEIKPCNQVINVEQTLLGEKSFTPIRIKQEITMPYKSDLVEKMSNEQLARICVGVLNDMTLDNNIGNSGKKIAGSAGETYSDETIMPLVLADGPAGLRISPTYKLDENGKVKASENALAGILPGGAQKCEVDEETYYQYCTSIPIGTALAQTWNTKLCEVIGDVVGKEMQIFGVDIWLAPALNIHRNPLCGRNFEYYSEDPLLSGLVAAAITSGVQSNAGCSVTIKHFCCNNQETDRFFGNSQVGERALREIYLKGFKLCIEKSKPNALMTSYNLVNGTHTANSIELLLDVLRDEWNYNGIVMTDWMATGGLGAGAKYGSSTSVGCILASNDLIMPGRDDDFKDIMQAVNDGVINRSQLENCANRILKLSENKILI